MHMLEEEKTLHRRFQVRTHAGNHHDLESRYGQECRWDKKYLNGYLNGTVVVGVRGCNYVGRKKMQACLDRSSSVCHTAPPPTKMARCRLYTAANEVKYSRLDATIAGGRTGRRWGVSSKPPTDYYTRNSAAKTTKELALEKPGACRQQQPRMRRRSSHLSVCAMDGGWDVFAKYICAGSLDVMGLRTAGAAGPWGRRY